MTECERCGNDLPVQARWCDPCADILQPGPEPDPLMLGQTPEQWERFEKELREEFPDAERRWNERTKRMRRSQ